MHDDVGEILSDLTRLDELVDNAHDASKDSVSVSEPQPTRECKELGTLTAQRPIESSSDSSEREGFSQLQLVLVAVTAFILSSSSLPWCFYHDRRSCPCCSLQTRKNIDYLRLNPISKTPPHCIPKTLKEGNERRLSVRALCFSVILTTDLLDSTAANFLRSS